MNALPVLILALFFTALPTPALAGGGSTSATRVHLDKQGALLQVFRDAERVLELRCLLTPDETTRIEAMLRCRLDEGGFYVYAALRSGRPVGYAAIVNQVGKVKPITHIVAVLPDGSVSDVAVMIYRESHGGAVADERFVQQYRGLGLDDPIRIDRDIINVAGATLSGHAICRGVRKALAVIHALFLDDDATRLQQLLTRGSDVTPALLRVAPAEPATPGPASPTRTGDRPTPAASVDASASLRLEREVMGTVCAVEAWPVDGQGPDALAVAVAAALDEVTRWDGVLSDWRDHTPLSLLNRCPAGKRFAADPDLLAWLIDSRGWWQATDGAFDPGVGALVDAWDLRARTPSRPAPAVLQQALDQSGLRFLRLDLARGEVVREHAGLRLDPGASGKGYALDRAEEVLVAHGVHRALLSFRSTLLALGSPPGRDGWRIPVVHDNLAHELSVVVLAHGALSVSGGSLRTFDDGCVARGQVIDPRTGVPVEAVRLAWVRHPSAAAADALSTALLVRGPSLPQVDAATGAWYASPEAGPVDWPTSP